MTKPVVALLHLAARHTAVILRGQTTLRLWTAFNMPVTVGRHNRSESRARALSASTGPCSASQNHEPTATLQRRPAVDGRPVPSGAREGDHPSLPSPPPPLPPTDHPSLPSPSLSPSTDHPSLPSPSPLPLHRPSLPAIALPLPLHRPSLPAIVPSSLQIVQTVLFAVMACLLSGVRNYC